MSKRRRLGTFRLGEEVAHNTPSGFWGFLEEDVNALKGQFDDIRDGEGGTYQACDRLLAQAAVDPTFWGHGGDVPPSGWWQGGPPAKRNEAWRNANAWVGTTANKRCLLYEAAKLNVTNPDLDPSGTNPATGSFRTVISRSLFGLVRARGWYDEMIAAYVDRIRARLTEDNPISRNMRNACAGWYLEDDTFGRAILGPADVPNWRSMLAAAQDAQMARSAINPGATKAINLPFFFNWNIDSPPDTWVRTFASPTSPLPVPRDYYHYAWPGYMLEAMAKLSDSAPSLYNQGAFPDDAIRAFEPYFFPWSSNRWDSKRDDPAWYRWKKTIEAFEDAFPYDRQVAGEYINHDVQIHPIMESGRE